MGLLQAVEIPALDHARVAFALAHAGNVHVFSGFKNVGLDQIAHIELADILQPQLPQGLLGGDAALVEVALQGLGEALGLLVAEAYLNRLVAIVFGGLFLRYHAGAGLDDGDGDHFPLLIEDLRHADLLADDSFFHIFSSCQPYGSSLNCCFQQVQIRAARLGYWLGFPNMTLCLGW